MDARGGVAHYARPHNLCYQYTTKLFYGFSYVYSLVLQLIAAINLPYFSSINDIIKRFQTTLLSHKGLYN